MANNIVNGVMGLCVADALGVPVEFNTRETLRKNPVVGMRAYGTHNQPAGTWSDDTSMSLCLVASLSKGLNYEDIMNKFVKWFDEGAYTPYGDAFDIGIATSRALQRYKNGTKPLQCGGTTEYDNGNGSLMRILPILFYLQSRNVCFEQEEAFAIIHNVSALTHAHKRSQMACGIYVSIAAKLCEESDLALAVEQGVSAAMKFYRKHSNFKSELDYFRRLDNISSLPIDQVKSSGYVIDTLEAAIWCLLNTNSYKECVLKAVNLGEDTDSVAAVVGGLAGLHYGYESIPKEWLYVIPLRHYIENLCHTLHASFYGAAIEKLCKFLPYFETATKESVCKWTSAEKTGDKQVITPYPTYDKTFLDFIDEVYSSNLMDTDYISITQKLDGDLNIAIETADFASLRAILTCYVRAERFGDGAWARAVEESVFLNILKRLKEISKLG